MDHHQNTDSMHESHSNQPSPCPNRIFLCPYLWLASLKRKWSFISILITFEPRRNAIPLGWLFSPALFTCFRFTASNSCSIRAIVFGSDLTVSYYGLIHSTTYRSAWLLATESNTMMNTLGFSSTTISSSSLKSEGLGNLVELLGEVFLKIDTWITTFLCVSLLSHLVVKLIFPPLSSCAFHIWRWTKSSTTSVMFSMSWQLVCTKSELKTTENKSFPVTKIVIFIHYPSRRFSQEQTIHSHCNANHLWSKLPWTQSIHFYPCSTFFYRRGTTSVSAQFTIPF